MRIWWVLLVGWIVVQVPFIIALSRWKHLASRYPMSVTSRLLIPWNSAWKSRVRPEDLEALAKYRRFLLVYYYGVFLSPIIGLFAVMAGTAAGWIS